MATEIYGKRNHHDDLSVLAHKAVKLFNSASSHSVALVAPGSLAADYTLTLPVDDGNSGQLLSTDGSGVLSWATALTSSLVSDSIFVGVSGTATAVDTAAQGDIAATSTGLNIKSGVIINSDINASAAIAYSKLNLAASIVNADIATGAAIAYAKLNLAGSIVNADVNASAAIAYSKLALTGSIVNADINASAAIAYSKLALTGSIVNADVAAGAAVAYNKLAALTTARALVSDGSGFVSAATTTATEIGYVNGVTSAIQTQLNAKARGFAATWALADGAAKTITHSLGSTDVLVQLYDLTDGSQIAVDSVVTTDANTLDLTASQAPAAAGWRVVIIRV